MKINQRMSWILGMAVVVVIGAAGFGAYRMGIQQGMAAKSDVAKPAKADKSPQADEDEIGRAHV